tara:strand:- start:1968 stop:2204 length:237 start_codon:yes stop_codon:yes gene_type:complete
MKIVKIIDSINGQITLYDNDTYILNRGFNSYVSLIRKKNDLIYDLVDAGFVIRDMSLKLGANKNGLRFILSVKMTFYK